MIRKLSFVCVIGWLLCVSSSVFADNEKIFEALTAPNSSSAQFQDPATAQGTMTEQDPEKTIFEALTALNSSPDKFKDLATAQATAREFFNLVQTASHSADVLSVLKELKSNKNTGDWKEVQNAENELMAVVKETLDATCRESISKRAGSGTLGTLVGFGYSGKWPLKPKSQLTFDGDFDVTLYATNFAVRFLAATEEELNPKEHTGIHNDVVSALTEALGASPESLGIVITENGFEGEAGVYVTRAGKLWALMFSMNKLYLVHPDTGGITDITGSPEKLSMNMQLMLLSKLHPELFENGFRLKKGVTMEQVKQVLLEDPRLDETYKIYLQGKNYSIDEVAAGGIDFYLHFAEVKEATDSLEKRTKVAKNLARFYSIFINAMGGPEGQWRKQFLPSDIEFMRQCTALDQAKITYANAENARVQFLLSRRDAGETTETDQDEYAGLKAAADAAKAALDSAEHDVMETAGSDAHFFDWAGEIIRKQAQVAHRDFILDLMSRPPAERARRLAAYEADLKALLKWHTVDQGVPTENKQRVPKQGVPAEAIEWAQKALDAIQKLSEVCRNNAQAMEGIGGKLKRIYEIFNNPDKIRENVERLQNVKRVLGETVMGNSLLEKTPGWVFFTEPPSAITDIAFESPVNFIAEAVVAPVNTTVNALMMIDIVLQLADVWSTNQTDTQKVMSTAGIVSMLVVNHLYLVPALYHASLTGDPKQITYVLACFICPPAMLPQLVDSFGTRIVSGAKQSLFNKELEAMFEASTFVPDRGQEPKEWADNRDLVHYRWQTLESQVATYEGKESLANYIKVLSADTREEIPLSAKNMTGLGALILPGGVAKSFRAMIEDGDHPLFHENEALASALAALQTFNCDRLVPFMDKAPANCRDAWAQQKGDIRLDLINNDFAVGEVARLQAEGKSGENMIWVIRTMLDKRAGLQNAVIDELAGAIIASFEEEKRARKLVELGLVDDALKELLALGEELAIKDELKDAVTEALRLAGVGLRGDALGQSTSGIDAKKREQIAKVTDSWLKTYRSVAETRRMLVALVGGYGTPKTDLDRFLRGKPPLQVVPAKDSQAVQTSQKVLMGTPGDASSIIYKFKGDKLDPDPRDSASEATLLRYLFTARIMELTVDIPLAMISLWRDGPGENESPSDFADHAQAELKRELDMKNKSFWGGAPDFAAYLDRYQILARGYAEKFAALRDQYQTTPVQLTVQGLTQVETGKQVILKVVPTRNGKPADDALKSARVEWAVKGAVNNTGLVWQFTPDKEEVLNITVNAVLEIGGKRTVIGTATHQVAVIKPEEKKTPEKTDKITEDTKDAKKDGKEKVTAVVTGPVNFSVSVSGNWEGGNTKDGLALTRKPAKIKGPCGSDATVTATLSASFDAWSSKPYAKNKDEALAQAGLEFKANRPGDTPNDMAVGLFMAGGIEGVTGVSMGEYAGAIADFAIWVRRGSSSDMGSHDSYLGANGRGAAVKEGVGLIRFKYNVRGSGCYDNSDRPYLITQAASAQQEAKAILASLRVDEKGQITQQPYRGPNYDGSDLPKVVLVPPQLPKLNLGDTVKIQAVVQNAKPEDNPLQYNWGGTFDGKPEDFIKGDTVRITPAKPGKQSVSVSVDGARFGLGSASLEYEVRDVKVKVERVPSGTKPAPTALADNRVVIGQSISLRAVLTSDGQPFSGVFIYRWEPHDADFKNQESASADTTAVFKKPGTAAVVVTVLQRNGAVLQTLAESDRFDLEVIQPAMKLTFQPPDPFIGQETKVKVSLDPDLQASDSDFRWEFSGGVQELGESRDTRERTFLPKDANAIHWTVRGRVPASGESLGEAQAVLTAKPFKVTTTTRTLGPKPMVWKQGVGLVEEDTAIAVHQQVILQAAVEPAPFKQPVYYRWSVNDGTSFVSVSEGREVTVTRTEVGDCMATVEVEDGNGFKLGNGTVRFSASISQAAMDEAKKKQQESVSKAAEKVQAESTAQKVDDLLKQGKISEAAAAVDGFSKQDPQAAAPLRVKVAGEAKKQGWDVLRNWDFDQGIKNLELAVRLDPSDADAKSKLAQANDSLNKWQEMNRLAPQFQSLIQEKKLFSAYAVLGQIDRLNNSMTGAPAGDSPLKTKLNKIYADANKEFNDFYSDFVARTKALVDAKDWEGAIQLCRQALQRELGSYEQGVRSSMSAYEINLAEQSKMWNYYLQTKAGFERGDYSNADLAGQASRELRARLSYFSPADPRRKEIDSLAAAIDRGVSGPGTVQPRSNQAQKQQQEQADKASQIQSLMTQGKDLANRKDFAGAINAFTKVIELAPNNEEAYIDRGGAKFNQKDYQGAMADWSQAMTINPKNPVNYNNRGAAKKCLGDMAGAQADFQKAVELNPNYELAKRNLAATKAEINKPMQPPPQRTASTPQYQKVDLSSIGGVAGIRGGEIKYKGKIPIGGNVTDGSQFQLPWFSSNTRHTQRARLSMNHFRADTLYVMANCAWWGSGDQMQGKPILGVRTNGAVERDLISGINIWDWNATLPSPGSNTEQVANRDPGTSYTYITRFEFPETDVTSIEILLLAPTKADNSRLNGQQVIELFGVTLGYEGQSIQTPPRPPSQPPLPGTNTKPGEETAGKTGISSASGELEGDWIIDPFYGLGGSQLHFTRNGGTYTGVLATCTAPASSGYSQGMVYYKLTRVSEHIYKGQGLWMGFNGPEFHNVSVSVVGNEFYNGEENELTEHDPYRGADFARRK
jgi:tetratricopeptide (TPR) repeat protein